MDLELLWKNLPPAMQRAHPELNPYAPNRPAEQGRGGGWFSGIAEGAQGLVEGLLSRAKGETQPVANITPQQLNLLQQGTPVTPDPPQQSATRQLAGVTPIGPALDIKDELEAAGGDDPFHSGKAQGKMVFTAAMAALGLKKAKGAKAAVKAEKLMPVDGTLGTASPNVVFRGKQPHEFTPQDWGDFGRAYGVDNLGPASEKAWRDSLGTVKTQSGREVTVPGGLDSKEPFTYYDLLHLKAQGIDPNDLLPHQHQAIHDRMIRAMQPGPGGPTDTQILNQTMFGMISPNQPLTPNELALQRVMSKGPKDLKTWNEMIPYDYKTGKATEAERRVLSNQITEKLGLQAAPRGGIGASGGADYANIAEMTQKMRDRPDFYRFNPDAPEFKGMTDAEKWAAHVTRVMNETRGLAAKTGSLASVWQSPETAAISAIDRHMATKFFDQIFSSNREKTDFKRKLVDTYNAGRPPEEHVRTFPQLLEAPGGRGHFVEKTLGYVDNTPEVTTQFARTGEYNPRIPKAVQQTEWISGQPNKTSVIEGPYVRALNANAAEAGNAGQSTFSNQWMLWDRIRGRLEPHEILFPGLEQLPRMSLEQMKAVQKEHAGSGYLAAEGRVRPVPQASRLGYFSLAPLLGGAAVGGGLLADDESQAR